MNGSDSSRPPAIGTVVVCDMAIQGNASRLQFSLPVIGYAPHLRPVNIMPVAVGIAVEENEYERAALSIDIGRSLPFPFCGG